MSAPMEQAARLVLAINELSDNVALDLTIQRDGVAVQGRMVSAVGGYRSRLDIGWSDLNRNPELVTVAVLKTALGLARAEARFDQVTPAAALALADGVDQDEGAWAARWAVGAFSLAIITAVIIALAKGAIL